MLYGVVMAQQETLLQAHNNSADKGSQSLFVEYFE
jgi:hypothetical protein